MIRRKLKGTVKHPKIEAFLEKYKIPMEYFRFNRRMLAKGVATGLFFAFIPMPLQILTVTLLAPFFRYNIPAAVAMCLLTNPLTMPIVYYIEYLTGSFLLGIEPQSVNLSSTEYHNHKSLKIGKVFKIKFVGLAVANSRISFRKDCLFLGFPLGFTRFPIGLDTFF